MVRIRLPLALLLMSLAATPVLAQGFSTPGQVQNAAPPAPAMPPAPVGSQNFPQPQTPLQPPAAPAPLAQQPAPMQPPAPQSPGFNNPSPQANPGAIQPARVNYADELTDFGVAPQTTLQTNVGSPTPLTIPGGHVITTAEMEQAVGSDILFIDVWDVPAHPTLPGAILIPGAGRPGDFSDGVQQQLWKILGQLSHMQAQHPIVFLCAGSRCWESYNAGLRAINMGFKMVLWYRGGLAAWQAAGQQMVTPGQGQNAPRQQSGVGFGK